jgi:hypothetical protein
MRTPASDPVAVAVLNEVSKYLGTNITDPDLSFWELETHWAGFKAPLEERLGIQLPDREYANFWEIGHLIDACAHEVRKQAAVGDLFARAS